MVSLSQPFVLAEWELSADSPIERSAPATIRFPPGVLDDERAMLGRHLQFEKGFSLVMVRSEDEEDEASWTPVNLYGGRPLNWPLSVSLEQWEDLLSGDREYGRVVCYGKTLGILHPDGRANWHTIHPREATSQSPKWYVVETREPTPFRWHDGTYDWTSVPPYEWKEVLDQELQNPCSDASFAYRWASLSDEQRRETVWECNQGWENFIKVLRWMLTVQTDLDCNNNYAIIVQFFNRGRSVRRQFAGLCEWKNDGDEPRNTRLDWGVARESAIKKVFSIRPRSDVIERYSCTHNEFGYIMSHTLLVERGPISQHERLEAHLALREWAQGKVSDDLLQMLL